MGKGKPRKKEIGLDAQKSKILKELHAKSPSRNWMWTINNWTDDDVEQLAALYDGDNNLTYLVCGKEHAPTTNTPHLQCYAQWSGKSSGQRYSYISKRLTRAAHIKRMYSNPQACNTYCLKEIKKEGDPFLWGKFDPKTAKGKNRGEEAKKMLLARVPMFDIANEHFGYFMRYNRGMLMFQDMARPSRTWKTHVTFIHGPTGCGKTEMAHEIHEDIWAMDFQNGFWSPYNGQEHILWDDYSTEWFAETLFLRLTDRYPCRIRQMGGWAEWCPQSIIITSNHGPSVFTPRQLRRIDKIIDMTNVPIRPPKKKRKIIFCKGLQDEKSD
ncbi:MAG TPA: hypothetical protein EYN67_14840 [Flavobacteriales bacterium]|nr:hypothetical protein [Flavobacteriales bacterium]